jgi:hypothetical protein
LKRLDKAAKLMDKFEQKKTWEKFVLDREENYKDNKQLLYAVMRNKTKPKSEIKKILDQNGNLVWTRRKYLQTWKNYYERLLATEEKIEDVENNLPTTSEENQNIDMMDVESAVGQMKNKSLGYDEVTVEMVPNAGPLGM